ncbi:MAG: hypothetical protein ACRECQ_05020, partial [Burkholderiaceae bacterium]
ASPDVVRLIGVAIFFGAWFWNAERTQRTAARERAIEQAEKDFEKFDPKIIEPAWIAQFSTLLDTPNNLTGKEHSPVAKKVIAALRAQIEQTRKLG